MFAIRSRKLTVLHLQEQNARFGDQSRTNNGIFDDTDQDGVKKPKANEAAPEQSYKEVKSLIFLNTKKEKSEKCK